jgi:glycosyltransferase involved in cell wall biosynthesis
MKILCVTDQLEGSRESLIEGIFRGGLREQCQVYLVNFSRELRQPELSGYDIRLPYGCKRRGAAARIAALVELQDFDIVIVRNFFPVLRSFVQLRDRYRFRLGFWNTFPHTFRRYFEAQQERRALLRKSIEYRVRSWLEQRLVQRCDFLMVMSPQFKASFFDQVALKCHYLPMGFRLEDLPSCQPLENRVRKFIYVGTVDPLRRTELIVAAMIAMPEEFHLDIYTQSDNAAVEALRNIRDPRVTLCPPLPREQLMALMATYDVGIGLIPENPLYNVSSPTKTVEYYAVGLPAIINYLPEYTALFDGESAFFCAFETESIQGAVRQALGTSKAELIAMGRKGQETVRARRDYQVLSAQLYQFLQTL